jgi:protein ImuB
MPNRRILSLWFPRLAAERVLRAERGTIDGPLAVVADRAGTQVLSSLDARAEAEGLRPSQPLRDAQAMCPHLVTRLASSQAEETFLALLRRWAGKFSPWVAEEPPAGLVIDLTGCAHLFGGEAPLLAQVEADCANLGLTVRLGVADTLGAAWALARFAGRGVEAARSGDAIDMEAPATRSRAARRRSWEKGGPAPGQVKILENRERIAGQGLTRTAIAPLPVAAVRIDANTVAELARLGLRRIEDLAGQPRAALARRFGVDLLRRLDQAMGVVPEPVSPAAVATRFAVRLTLPDPIGLEEDILAAIDRLLPVLAKRLKDKGNGARRVRMQCFRTDQGMQWVEVGLARPSAEPERIRPLLAMKVSEIDAGFGIDAVRIEAVVTEPVYETNHKGGQIVTGEIAGRRGRDTAREDLIGRLGARIGLEAITRIHPADSHVPEKTQTILAAAWSEPAGAWPAAPERPLTMWRPEPVGAQDVPQLPMQFRWRGRIHETATATGPERIAPDWWLDEPEWRSGVRDYWRISTAAGDRLWLYYAHGGAMSSGWFCQGRFA